MTKNMTYRQLAEWLAKGNGECIGFQSLIVSTSICYDKNREMDAVDKSWYKIRKWDSGEWIDPTVDVYEEDCR